jgi:hypothetical protein
MLENLLLFIDFEKAKRSPRTIFAECLHFIKISLLKLFSEGYPFASTIQANLTNLFDSARAISFDVSGRSGTL